MLLLGEINVYIMLRTINESKKKNTGVYIYYEMILCLGGGWHKFGGGGKIGQFMKQKAQNTRIDNNKTNKAQASRFCSTASHYWGKNCCVLGLKPLDKPILTPAPHTWIFGHCIRSGVWTARRPIWNPRQNPINLNIDLKPSLKSNFKSHSMYLSEMNKVQR